LPKGVEELHDDFRSAQPFPHLVFDSLFPDETLEEILDEGNSLSKESWVHNNDDRIVKAGLRSAVDLGDAAYRFSSMMHSAGFLYFLSEITGIKALLPDPYLTGGGYSVVPEGGKFDVHADRNTDHHSGLLRRIVVLTYLNKNWKHEYGGQLELWNQEATACEKVIEPIFNRTVIFEIGDKNFHAVRPVTKGTGLKRRAFMAYFHTVSQELVMHNSIFAPPIYQSQPAKPPLMHRIKREVLPPIVLRAMNNFKKDK
jgi:hypothetical protein